MHRNVARKSTAAPSNQILQTKRAKNQPKDESVESAPRRQRARKSTAAPSRRVGYSDEQTERQRVRIRPGQLALQHIRTLQNTTDMLIPKARFHRLVREITEAHLPSDGAPFKYQIAALVALQEAAEAYITNLFEDSYLCTIHSRRVMYPTLTIDSKILVTTFILTSSIFYI